MDEQMRQELIEIARGGVTIAYSVLRPNNPRGLGRPLDEISIYEYQNGRPLLSAVVVHVSGDCMPGTGFFDTARKLGRYKGNNQRSYWRKELELVWDYWRA